MKRITQNLFEEIQKITSGQIDEKKKVDQDKDGDNDFADVMMARRKASGQSHAQAHAATRKHNEEVEQQDEALWPGTPEYNKKFPKDSKPGQRMSKQDYGYRGPSGSETEDKPSSEEGKEKGRGRRKIRSEDTEIFEDGKQVMKPVDDDSAITKSSAKMGRDNSKADDHTKVAPTNKTMSDPASAAKFVNTAKTNKVREYDDKASEVVVKENSFDIEISNNLSFRDYLNAARLYVGEEDAVSVAEAFFKDQDDTLVIEAKILEKFDGILKKISEEGNEIYNLETSILEGCPCAEYIVVESKSGVARKYIHLGTVHLNAEE
jgi:hypothetical protein